MYHDTLHRRRDNFCGFCLQAYSTAEILKHHINNCFKNLCDTNDFNA